MKQQYIVRRAEKEDDILMLRDMYNDIFHPEKVGDLADVMFHHLPKMDRNCWFTAADQASGEMAAAVALVPWTWSYEGVRLRVAEMGLVGTSGAHRGRGLMRRLNAEFEQTLDRDGFDISVIQGIPGFYNTFGYYYAVDFENHIDLPLSFIPDHAEAGFAFRPCDASDIPFLLKQDEAYRAAYCVSVVRDRAEWEYLLTHSLKTEYGSNFWMIENREGSEAYYCRSPRQGFGHGLIVSEVSEDISHAAFVSLLSFLKQNALERGKPHIRLNLNNDAHPGRMAISMGAKAGRPYAWQIKIPDKVRFLKKIKPVLEKRAADGPFGNHTGLLRLELYRESVDLEWKTGRLTDIRKGTTEAADNAFCIPADLFPALVMGYRSWRELQMIRPDIFPSNQYLRVKPCDPPDENGFFMDVLFPKTRSWVYERY